MRKTGEHGGAAQAEESGWGDQLLVVCLGLCLFRSEKNPVIPGKVGQLATVGGKAELATLSTFGKHGRGFKKIFLIVPESSF